MSNISTGQLLMGLGAAVSNQGPQYVQGLKQEQQQMSDRKRQELEYRQKAMYQDGYQAFQMLSNGNLDGIISLANDRLEMLGTFPDADPSDTMRILSYAEAAKAGDPTAIRNLSMELSSAANMAVNMGIVTPQKPEEYTLKAGETRFSGSNPLASLPAEVEPGFEIIPQSEVSAIPGLDPTKPYQRNIKTNQISQVGGAGTTVNVGTATEGERKAGTLANRLDFAMSQVNDVMSLNPDAAMPGKVASLFGAMGMDYLSNLSNPADRQIIEAAQEDMLDAALTLGTGAAYTKEQLAGYKKSYFPQLGDTDAVISAKRTRLQNLIKTAYDAAGRAAPENMLSADNAMGEVPDGVPAGSYIIGKTPDGVNVWKDPSGKNWTEN